MYSLKQQNPQTRDKFQDTPTPLPRGRHKCMVPKETILISEALS